MIEKLPEDNEHVKYEFDMLKLTYEHTQNFKDYWGNKQTFLFNVLHESFCVHAYNLINWMGPNSEIKPYLKLIKDQILTLGPNRTGEFSKKISIDERDVLYLWIMDRKSKPVTDAFGRVKLPAGSDYLKGLTD